MFGAERRGPARGRRQCRADAGIVAGDGLPGGLAGLAPARAPGVPPSGPCCGVVWVVCGCIERPAGPARRAEASAGASSPARAVIATSTGGVSWGGAASLADCGPGGVTFRAGPGPVQAAATPRNEAGFARARIWHPALRRRRRYPAPARRPAMPATAQTSSWAETSPLMPTAPRITPSAPQTSTPPGTGTALAAGDVGQRVHEALHGGGAARQLPPAEAQRQRAIGLAERDLGPQQGGAVLPLRPPSPGRRHRAPRRSAASGTAPAPWRGRRR